MNLKELMAAGRNTPAPKIVIYGREGIGKSTLASKAKSPLFLLTENGLRGVSGDVRATPLATMYKSVIDTLTAVRAEGKAAGVETLVIDTADALEVLIHRELCTRFKADYLEKVDGGYGKGHAYAEREWRKLLVDYIEPIAAAGIAVVFCAHAQDKKVNDLELGEYSQYCLKLHDKARHVLVEWSDAVLFMTRSAGAAKGDDKGRNPRILRCNPRSGCEAKNRFGIPDEIPSDDLWKYIYTKKEKEN